MYSSLCKSARVCAHPSLVGLPKNLSWLTFFRVSDYWNYFSTRGRPKLRFSVSLAIASRLVWHLDPDELGEDPRRIPRMCRKVNQGPNSASLSHVPNGHTFTRSLLYGCGSSLIAERGAGAKNEPPQNSPWDRG